MSFILDALKKSQRTRQRQAGPATVAVETARRQVQPHNWWALVIAIVALNLAVVAGFAWYVSREQRTSVPTTAAPAESTAASAAVRNRPPETSDSEAAIDTRASAAHQANGGQVPRPAADRNLRPLATEIQSPARQPGSQADRPAREPASGPPPQSAASAVILPSEAEEAGYLPTLAELQLDQRVQLSPLHVDVHVYNENPRRRFVLINTTKYKEGERLKEGPLLEEIRSDGLVMYYRGERFLVPRN